MKAPAFWQDEQATLARLLSPLGWVYANATAWRLAHARPWRAPVPVLGVGNLTAGGAGKTPVVRDLARRLAASNPGILSRGYGGTARAPLKVDPAHHTASEVGDEALMLAGEAPCWVSANRAQGARAMAEAGIGLIVMDDGLQHTSLAQDLRLVVVDGAAGFGNGRPIPAGPLRETVEAGIARADALIVMGEDEKGLAERFRGRLPVLGASVAIKDAAGLADRTVLGFAGIGRPSKFRASLAGAGARIADFREFPDHYPYDDAELDALAAEAEALDAQLVTTEKDWVRLSPPWRARIAPVSVAVAWRDEAALAALLGRLARHG